MRNGMLKIRKALLRLMLALMMGMFAGAVPGVALVAHAETAASVEAVQPEAEATAAKDDGTTFLMGFFGGIILLILFVVVIVVATTMGTAGVVGAQEDD